MTVRTTQLYNTLFNPDASPSLLALVKAQLLASATQPQYNVAGPSQGDSVQPTLIQTLTASAAPTALTALDVGGGGGLGTGAYTYKVSFMKTNASGVSYETAASVASNSISATSGDHASLTAIPLGDSITTARRLYRTTVGGSTYALLATINDNTTTVYSDTIADGSLLTDAPLVLGEYRLNIIAPTDLLPATLHYALTEGTVSSTTTSFNFNASAVLASTLYSSSPTPATPTDAFTGYVIRPDSTGIQGVNVTAVLSATGVSTVSALTILGGTVISATTDGNGAYSLALVPTDRMTPGGLYYTVVEGSGGSKTIAAPFGGGTVNANIITPTAATTTTTVTLSPSVAQTGKIAVSGTVSADSFVSNSSAPAFAAVTGGAGTGSSSAGSTGTDGYGTLVLLTGTAAWATGAQATITYATVKTAAPIVTFYPGNAATAALWGGFQTYSSATTSIATLGFGVADTAQHTLTIRYTISG